MTLEQIRNVVLDSRADTLMAQRFREAFGIRGHQERMSRTVTHEQYRKRKERAALMECMAQRIGALDRGAS